jgi:glycosyltransferase involved in cell wall biosynthesis
MRVLIVHNGYQMAGGEDAVVASEAALLEERGHPVMQLRRHNRAIEGMNRLRLAANTFWSVASHEEVTMAIRRFRPDVLHAHNTFPLFSPSIYWAAAAGRVPVVQTLHNFRLLCPQAMFLRDGRVCEDCLGRVPWRGVAHGCYRASRVQTAMLAGTVTVHRALGTWKNKVTRFIALNAFCRDKFIDGGLPAERIVIKPNFVSFDHPVVQPRSGFLFVGRLSAEKGVRVLAGAAALVDGAQVKVAGTGPEASVFDGVARIELLGGLDGDAVREQMSSAAALVLPSIWYENFPRTLVEAMGCALPVIASRLGALAELVEDGVTGLLFEPGSSADLAEKMRWAMANPERLAAMGVAAHARYKTLYSAERNYNQLIEIYRDAIAAVRTEAADGLP